MSETTLVPLPRRRALPHAYGEGALELTLKSCTLDSGAKPSIEPTRRLVELFAFADWKRATIEAEVRVSETLPEAVFDPSERKSPPAELRLLINCRDTLLRESRLVKGAPVGPGTYSISFDVDQKDFRGEMLLQAVLVRTERRKGKPSKFAFTRYARLADSGPWAVQFDEPVLRRGFLDTKWQSLEPHRVYRLDLSNASHPVLLLNLDHQPIYTLLRSEGSTGPQARARDLLFGQIYYGVWTQLVFHTASSVDTDGAVPEKWQEGVLRFLRDLLYAGKSLTEVGIELREATNTPEKTQVFTQQLDEALQKGMALAQKANQLAREGGSE